MVKVVYADVLFFLNFGGDILTVCVTARLCRLMTRPLRAAAGAAAGAFLSVLITLFLDGALSFVAGIPVAALICLIAFGKTNVSELLRRTAITWSSACLIYGVVSSVTQAIGAMNGSGGKLAAAVACAVSVPAVLIVSRLRRERAERSSALVRFSVCGVTVGVLCLVDSGNLLKEPVSGDPVMIVASAAVHQLPGEVVSYLLHGVGDPPDEILPRMRLIPSRTLTGEELLRALRPDSVYVNGTEKRAFVTLREAGKGSFGTYDGIVPRSIT